MDALTEILNTLRLQSRLYFRTELTRPWGVVVPREGNVARFHIVIRGECWIQIEGEQEPHHMANGDLIVVPHGAEHTLLDHPDTTPRPLSEVLSDVDFVGEGPLVYGGGGAGCCLVCGEFYFDEQGSHPLLENLPPKLCIDGVKSQNAQWLDSAIGFIAQEATSSRPGANAIVNRLSEIIFIQVIRLTLDHAQQPIPFLSAFVDPKISRVLSCMHKHLAENWTVETLGRLANMSRSAFSQKFTERVNMSPLQYLMFIRLQRAAKKLRETNDSLLSIADEIGYQSEAAFSLAFKKQFNLRPGEYRKQYA